MGVGSPRTSRQLTPRAAFRRRVREAREQAGPSGDYSEVRDAVLGEAGADTETLLAWFHEDFHIADKDAVFHAARRDKHPIDATGVIAASRLYTPHHIVAFLLHNTVGAMFCEMYPDSPMAAYLTYRVVPRHAPPREPRPLRELRLLDPCCGCGAFLLPAYDLLVEMYAEERRLADAGVISSEWVTAEADVPATIVDANLWGADLDSVAVDLVTAALMRRAGAQVVPNVHVPALPIGSLAPDNWPNQRFEVVVTNPPYVGFRQLDPRVKEAVRAADPHARSDLAVAFQSRVFGLLSDGGLAGTVTPASWTTGRESLALRRDVLSAGGPCVAAALGQRVFDEAPLLFIAATVVRRGDANAELAILRPPVGSGADGLAAAVSAPQWVPRATVSSLPLAPFLPVAPPGLLKRAATGPRVGDLFRSFDGIWTGDNAADTRYWWELPHRAPGWVRLSGGQGHAPWAAPIRRRMHREHLAGQVPRDGGVEYARVAGGRLAARQVEDGSGALAGIVTLVPRHAEGAERVEELLAVFNSRVGTAWLRTLTSGLNFNPGYAAEIPLGVHPPDAALRVAVTELVRVHRELATGDPTSDTFVALPDPQQAAELLATVEWRETEVDERVCDHFRLDRLTRTQLDPTRRASRNADLVTDALLVTTLRELGFLWPAERAASTKAATLTVSGLTDRLVARPTLAELVGSADRIRRWVHSGLARDQRRRFCGHDVLDVSGEHVTLRRRDGVVPTSHR